MTKESEYENVIGQIRNILKAGCTIKATDVNHVLEPLGNGQWHGGLYITPVEPQPRAGGA